MRNLFPFPATDDVMSKLAPLMVALALSAGLAACATAPTFYAPAATPQGVGFSDYRLEADRFRITFRGGPGAPAAQVADYALLRASDLALTNGYDWFRITERYMTRSAPTSGTRLSIGTGSGSFGRHGGVGLGLGTSFDLGGGPSLSQTLEVVLGKGPRPQGADVYDARDVRQTIAPRV